MGGFRFKDVCGGFRFNGDLLVAFMFGILSSKKVLDLIVPSLVVLGSAVVSRVGVISDVCSRVILSLVVVTVCFEFSSVPGLYFSSEAVSYMNSCLPVNFAFCGGFNF